MFPFKELHFPPCCLLLPLKYYYLPEMVGHPLKVSAIIYYVILSITQPGRSSSFITLTDLNYRRIYLLPLFVLKTNLSIIPPSFRPVTLIKMWGFFPEGQNYKAIFGGSFRLPDTGSGIGAIIRNRIRGQ